MKYATFGCVAAKCPRHGDPPGMAVHIKRPVALTGSRSAPAWRSRHPAVRRISNQSVPEVVEQVLRKHGLQGPDFDFRLSTYPPREIITQWRETDLQFIRRILSEVGIYWRTEMDDP